MGPNNPIAVSMQLHNPSWGIRVLSSETIFHFLKKIKIKKSILFNHKCSHLSLALPIHYAVIGKVTESQTSFTNVFNKTISDDFEWDGVFRPILPFWTKVHRQITNHVWPFQRNYIMREDMHVHSGASARRALVAKKHIHFLFFLNDWPFP